MGCFKKLPSGLSQFMISRGVTFRGACFDRLLHREWFHFSSDGGIAQDVWSGPLEVWKIPFAGRPKKELSERTNEGCVCMMLYYLLFNY